MAYENIAPGVVGPTPLAGAPVAGTTEVQTLTIGGTPTGGTFTLALGGLQTAPITWSATNATLLANIQAALDARFGTNQIVASLGTITAGIGTILLTFSGANYVRSAVATLTVTNSLTGTSPTLAVAETTPGVNASPPYAPIGSVWVRTDNGTLYVATAVGTLTAQV
jgi:hypothetical protein